MPKFKLQISMSLDGYVAGPNQSEEHPLGEGGEQLHEWAVALAGVARAPRPGGRRGQRLERRSWTRCWRTSARSSWAATCSARPRPVGGASVGRLVGRGPAVPRAGLRAHAP